MVWAVAFHKKLHRLRRCISYGCGLTLMDCGEGVIEVDLNNGFCC